MNKLKHIPTKGPFFLESEIGRPSAESSLFHVIPFSFEGSVSYGGGTRKGPDALIEASQQLELFDGTSCPGEKGIFTHQDLVLTRRRKSYNDYQVTELFQKSGQLVRSVLELGGVPVIIGGEHSISYEPIMAALEYCHGDLGVVQIDAHGDLRKDYQGKFWSHASVMRRCADQGVPILQLGTRAYSYEEQNYRTQCPHIAWIDGAELAQKTPCRIEKPEGFPSNIYLSIDLDGLDPSVIQATGTPVPGGLLWYPFMELMKSIFHWGSVVAFDCVELAPQKGAAFSNFNAAQLVYNVMGMKARS